MGTMQVFQTVKIIATMIPMIAAMDPRDVMGSPIVLTMIVILAMMMETVLYSGTNVPYNS